MTFLSNPSDEFWMPRQSYFTAEHFSHWFVTPTITLMEDAVTHVARRHEQADAASLETDYRFDDASAC
jgi:hypothetical protein